MTWKLKFKSLLSSVNWETEAKIAYQQRDWHSFQFCLLQSPTLAKNKLFLDRWPLLMAIESGDTSIVNSILGLGVDPNVHGQLPVPSRWRETDRAESDSSSETFMCARKVPFWVPIPVNALVIARSLALDDIYNRLLEVVSSVCLFQACQAALMLDDQDWISSFDLPSCFAGVELDFNPASIHENPGVLSGWTTEERFKYEPIPVIATMFGGCSIDIFREVWSASPSRMRQCYHVESPGYGHDNDKVYGGYPRYWAELLNRPEIIGFLIAQGCR